MVRVALIAALLLAVAATPAAAATVEDLKTCYVSAGETDAERETIAVRGEGFTQESVVEVLFDGVAMGSALTGSIGEFELRLPAPFQRVGQRPLTVTVRDAAQEVVKTTRVTNLAMSVKPRNATPAKRVRMRGRGFTLGLPVFAHYLYGGELQRTVRLARRSTGPCGTFDLRRRLLPIENARAGRWVMQVDQRRAYSPEPNPVWVRRPVVVSFGS
jgi:hypothetical protein